MRESFFSGINEPSPARSGWHEQATASGSVTEPEAVRRKVHCVRVLLAVLDRDFETADSMRWTLFKQRVDLLIQEIERLLGELHGQVPDSRLKPLKRQLRAYMHARLQGPNRS